MCCVIFLNRQINITAKMSCKFCNINWISAAFRFWLILARHGAQNPITGLNFATQARQNVGMRMALWKVLENVCPFRKSVSPHQQDMMHIVCHVGVFILESQISKTEWTVNQSALLADAGKALFRSCCCLPDCSESDATSALLATLWLIHYRSAVDGKWATAGRTA